nr:MAG TPA: hypothetical protein [Caudoviricetes sp.]
MSDFIKIIVDHDKSCYECYVNINSIISFAKGHSDCNCIINFNNRMIRSKTTMEEIKRLIEEKQQHKGE